MSVDHPPDEESLSIGEVLDLLKEEFPDITISKIRFLEHQGLLEPERTPSGYRKFYEPDVELLRWILAEQRDNFLPLKVIKDRLDAEGQGVLFSGHDHEHPPPAPAPGTPAPATGEVVPVPAAPVDEANATYTLEELGAATGLSAGRLSELQRFGLFSSHSVAGQAYFDADALAVARLAGEFASHGVEARHLRMFKTAAEREAGFYEQVVIPLLKQRNPTARRQAVETLTDLARLGDGLRSLLVRQVLRPYTEG